MSSELQLSAAKTNEYGEQYFTEVNQGTFAKQSSEMVYKGQYPELLNREEALYIVVGSDSGLFYQFVENHGKNPNAKFVFIDYRNVIEALDWPKDSLFEGNVRLVDEAFDFSALLSEFESYIIRKKIQIVKSIAVLDAKPGSAYHKLWDDIYARYQSFLTWMLLGQTGYHFENARLLNAADNIVPIKDFVGKLKGKTAVILGGGPTLDDAIDWIKQNQNNVLLFSAARIARRLKAEGIVPDFFVSVDPHDVSFDNSKGIFTFAEKSILLNSYHINPKLLGQWPGVACYIGTKYGWVNDEYDKNISSVGPNVINTATNLAFELGCENVIFSGVDFCYAKGQMYESGSDEVKVASFAGDKEKIALETNAGDLVPTQHRYAKGRDMMEAQVAAYLKKDSSRGFYTLGLYSAKMNNVTYLNPAQVSFTEAEDKTALVEEIKQTLTFSVEQRLKYAKKTKQELSFQLTRFRNIDKLAKEGEHSAARMVNDKTGTHKQKALNKVEKLRKKINRELNDGDGDLLMNYNASHFAETYKPFEDEQNIQSNEVADQLVSFFQGVSNAIAQYTEALEQAIERTQLRQAELEGELPSILYPQWQKLNEFGRAHLWKLWHADQTLAQEDQSVLDDCVNKFEQELASEETQHVKNLKQKAHDIELMIPRAEEAVKLKNASELNVLLTHCEKLDRSNQIMDLERLLHAMLLELENQFDEAIEVYESIQVPQVQHSALKRVLAISMEREQHEITLVTLEKLCRFSLDYMVSYSDLLELLGQREMAVQVLEAYLTSFPNKMGAQIKLAQKQLKLDNKDAAKQTLQKVLELDSDNQTAKKMLETL